MLRGRDPQLVTPVYSAYVGNVKIKKNVKKRKNVIKIKKTFLHLRGTLGVVADQRLRGCESGRGAARPADRRHLGDPE